ncbi:hypothetical protein ABE112_27965 [Priestia aryabhattai]|uniref:hypothetical protein n=1 Tax=Priestia aryabhattai TaxID=412384 RepID=UPI002E1A99D8|nr:hypothetical protein [Priestia aryabhattai]
MRIQVKANDSNNKNKPLIITVCNNYFKLSDAREVYRKSKTEGLQDDNVVIEIRTENEDEGEVKNTLVLGVEDAENMALTLLNISKEIKN